MMNSRSILYVFALLFFTACGDDTPQDYPVISQEFSDYWFDGRADVISYTLSQSRYGATRDGHAVLIFVTEPFSRTQQVKLDDPSGEGGDQVTVMKMNMVKKFTTGIYPYSLMLSAFSPADTEKPPAPLKFTMSGQEWCGQVFAQINRREEDFRLREFSYFQSEGDNDLRIPVQQTEDGIWNLIRMDPGSLPTGDFLVYPGLFHTRLLHRPFQEEDAKGTLSMEEGEQIYTLEYASGRVIRWHFEPDFPHMILGWEETIPSPDGRIQKTKATLKETLRIPYWQLNGPEDIIWRDSLGIL